MSALDWMERVLWTLTFAAQLVLLVVLMGRERARRFPWFTVGVAIFALRLMAEVLLSGRLAMVPFTVTTLTLANLATIVSLLVLVEVARRAFAGAQRPLWIVNAAGLVVLGGGILALWGPWPARQELALDTLLGRLRIMQLMAQKGDLLVAVISVGLLALLLLFGRRFKAGWRSHALMIGIGLGAEAIASLAIQGGLQYAIAKHFFHSRADFDQVRTILAFTYQAIFFAAFVWWIAWMWQDEPGAAAADDSAESEEPSPSGDKEE
jgi:hypothetical protein